MTGPTLKEFKVWLQARQDAATATMAANTGPLTPAYEDFKRTANVIREIDLFIDALDRVDREAQMARQAKARTK